MLISDIVRDANTEHEIYFLITAYVESVRFVDKLGLLPEQMTKLPLTDVRDLQERFTRLMIELDTASKGLNDKTCTAIKETLQVFGAGIARLQFIEDAHKQSRAQAVQALSQRKKLQAFQAQPEHKPPAQSDQLQP
jgi:hypothetical protein